MSFQDQGNAKGTSVPPERIQTQTPPLMVVVDSGVFKTKATRPSWVEAGTSARFTIFAEHWKDGIINPTWTGQVLDGNGNIVSSAITINPVQADPGSSGSYYVDASFASTVSPGDYEIDWSASYTPQGTSENLPIRARARFRIIKTTAPTQFVFVKNGAF